MLTPVNPISKSITNTDFHKTHIMNSFHKLFTTLASVLYIKHSAHLRIVFAFSTAARILGFHVTS